MYFALTVSNSLWLERSRWRLVAVAAVSPSRYRRVTVRTVPLSPFGLAIDVPPARVGSSPLVEYHATVYSVNLPDARGKGQYVYSGCDAFDD